MQVSYGKTEQRKKPKNKKRNKANKILALLLVLALFGTIFTVLAKTVLFPVKKINVTTNTNYTKEQIAEASGILINESKMYGFSSKKTEHRIILKLPYIKSVSFARSLNGVLNIKAEKDTALFCLETTDNAGKYVYLNKEYKVLEKSDSLNKNIILIKGINADKFTIGENAKIEKNEKFDLFKNIYEDLNNSFKDKKIAVNAIDVTDNSSIKFIIKGGITVNIGSYTNVEHKINHLTGMLDKLQDRTRGVIDLSAWSSSSPKGYFKEN